MAVELVKGNSRSSGHSACGQDGGVQLPRKYFEGILIVVIFMVTLVSSGFSLSLESFMLICQIMFIFYSEDVVEEDIEDLTKLQVLILVCTIFVCT